VVGNHDNCNLGCAYEIANDQVGALTMAGAANNSIPLDLADIISKDDAVPLMLRTLAKRKLSQREVEELVKLVRGKSD
jgi:hypothetical protein